MEQGDIVPAGVVPLHGSKVDLSPQEEHESEGEEPAPTYVFVIFLPDRLVREKTIKRNTYFLGGESLSNCYTWIKALRQASISRRIVKGQLDYARLELMDLEARWNVCKAIDSGKLPPMGTMFDNPSDEDPLVLQALADDVMILYRVVEIALKVLDTESGKKETLDHQLTTLNHLKDLQLTALSEKGKRQIADEDSKSCHQLLNKLIKKRFELRSSTDKMEVFKGHAEGGPGVQSLSQMETTLLTTIEKLDHMEDADGGNEQLPNEDRVVELQLAIVPIQEQYLELLAKVASGKEIISESQIIAAEAKAAEGESSEKGAAESEVSEGKATTGELSVDSDDTQDFTTLSDHGLISGFT